MRVRANRAKHRLLLAFGARMLGVEAARFYSVRLIDGEERLKATGWTASSTPPSMSGGESRAEIGRACMYSTARTGAL